jgi:hypothetical protein
VLQRQAGNRATAALVAGTIEAQVVQRGNGKGKAKAKAKAKAEEKADKAHEERTKALKKCQKYVQKYAVARGKVTDNGLFIWPDGNAAGEDSHHLHLYFESDGGHAKFMHQREIKYMKFGAIADAELEPSVPKDLQDILKTVKEYYKGKRDKAARGEEESDDESGDDE